MGPSRDELDASDVRGRESCGVKLVMGSLSLMMEISFLDCRRLRVLSTSRAVDGDFFGDGILSAVINVE